MAISKVLLSAIDQLMPTSYIRVFLVIKTGDSNFDAAVECLKKGLTRTQRQLPYIGGTIFETDAHEIGIEWEDQEPPPRIQITPAPENFPSSAQLQNAEHPFADVWRLNCPGDRFGDVKITKGLPAIAITCSPLDGWIVLGVSCFHSLWDIAGLSIFLHLWSRNTSKMIEPTSMSVIEHISLRDQRLRDSLKRVSTIDPTSVTTNIQEHRTDDPVTLATTTLQFDSVKLKGLGRQLSESSDTKTSANDLAIAVIWTLVSLVRCRHGKQASSVPSLRVLIDGRKYVFSPKELRAHYLGNLALPLFASLRDDNAAGSDLPRDFMDLLLIAVNAIRCSAQAASPVSFVQAISALDNAFDASSGRETHAAYNSSRLTSTSWSQAPMYVDFGAQVGKVEYVRIAPNDYSLEGMVLTLPRKRDGSQESNLSEIFVTLQPDELRQLQEHKVVKALAFDRLSSDTMGSPRARI